MPSQLSYENYDEVSLYYDSGGRVPKCADIIISNITENCNLLDAGCGTGNYLHPLVSSGKLSGYTGMDLNEKMLEQFSKKANALAGHVKINAKCADITKPLPFSDNEFDAVIVNHVFHHITNESAPTREGQLKYIEMALHEIYRIMKSGAVLCLNLASHKQLASLWFCELLYGNKMDRVNLRFPDVGEIEDLLTKSGFQITLKEVSHESLLGETYYEYEKYFDEAYRKAASPWTLSTPDELDHALKELRKKLENREEFDAHVRMQMKTIGMTHEIICTK